MYLLPARSHAIACVNQFIMDRAQALMDNIDTFIEVGHQAGGEQGKGWGSTLWLTSPSP